MAVLVDAIRERLAKTSDTCPPDVIQIERHYLVALLQQLTHVDCVERHGALELDAVSYTAQYAGRDLGLTKDMFLTLYAIASKPHGATYREIYDLCKGKGFVAGQQGRFEMNVRTMIKRLRQRLRESGLSDQMIESRPRVGYRWHDLAAATTTAAPRIDGIAGPYPLAVRTAVSAAVSETSIATPVLGPPG